MEGIASTSGPVRSSGCYNIPCDYSFNLMYMDSESLFSCIRDDLQAQNADEPILRSYDEFYNPASADLMLPPFDPAPPRFEQRPPRFEPRPPTPDLSLPPPGQTPIIEVDDLSPSLFGNEEWDPRIDDISIQEICNEPITEIVSYINEDDKTWIIPDDGAFNPGNENAYEVPEEQSTNILNLPEEFAIMVNPITISPVKKEIAKAPQEMVKPYHPTQDHDYILIDTDKKEVQLQGVKKLEAADTAEPDVDVWKIDKFLDEQAPLPRPNNRSGFKYNQTVKTVKKNTRRTSKRAADMKLRTQSRMLSNAVHLALNPKKPARQYKNIRPKNSVETTPSQSDIEEWQSQAVRPTCSKITKKKTTKGRIDHSASERHRREVLRKHFNLLRLLIPNNFLMGEKPTNQVSKQKILTGAQRLVGTLIDHTSSGKTIRHQNSSLRDEWVRKNLYRMSKNIRRQRTF